jgi:hypothetical protein
MIKEKHEPAAVDNHQLTLAVPQNIEAARRQTRELAKALSDLYQLLELYSPMWYTQDHRHRAQTALQWAYDSPPQQLL